MIALCIVEKISSQINAFLHFATSNITEQMLIKASREFVMYVIKYIFVVLCHATYKILKYFMCTFVNFLYAYMSCVCGKWNSQN